MTAIFYYIGFLLFVSYIPMLISYIKSNKIQHDCKITAKSKIVIVNELDRPIYMEFIKSGLLIIISLIWLLIGLLSNNWLSFLFIILVYVILNKSLSKIGDKNKFNYFRVSLYMILYAALSLSMLFISLNHFFFKYELSVLIKSAIGLS